MRGSMKQLALLVLFCAVAAAVDFETYCKPTYDSGPCKGYFPRWWFNVKTGQCEEFIYGGCQGNKNNHVTRKECETRCLRKQLSRLHFSPPVDQYPYGDTERSNEEVPEYPPVHLNDSMEVSAVVNHRPLRNYTKQHKPNVTSDFSATSLTSGVDFETYCKPTHDRGPCKAYIPRWWFNVKTGQCEQFIYGGCQGNKNNYETKRICETNCLRRQLSELEVSADVHYRKHWNETKYSPNVTVEYSAVHFNVTLNPVCNEPKYPGLCKGYFPRYYYNNKTKTCKKFIYGGCQSNGNNFLTLEECENTCLVADALEVSADVHYPKHWNNTRHWNGTEHRPNVTSEYSAVSPDAGFDFETYCRPTYDRGPCKAGIWRWWSNVKTGQCEKFLYGGCRGNENNHATMKECEIRCLRLLSTVEISADAHYRKHWNGTKYSPNVTTEYSDVHLNVTVNPVCNEPKYPGLCKGYFPRYYYNNKSKKCKKFIYGGCQSNGNNFLTLEECENTCLVDLQVSADVRYPKHWNNTKHWNGTEHRPNVTSEYSAVSLKAGVDFETYCKPTYDSGPCKGYFPRWWFNVKTGQCEQFIYGGCQGNKNNHLTMKECETRCLRRLSALEVSVDALYRKHWNGTKYSPNVTVEYSAVLLNVTLNPVCNKTKFPGPCRGYFPRYYFDNVTKTCEKFIYGGCQSNGNNFVTIEECKKTCWVSLDQNAVEEIGAFEVPFHPFAPPEVCTYPADSGPCKAYMPRFFYNTETKKCEEFIYGGCGGNANNFLTFDACEKKCLKVFGVIPRA
nr:papilin-like isoform X1 [Rhipicephalus microplus]